MIKPALAAPVQERNSPFSDAIDCQCARVAALFNEVMRSKVVFGFVAAFGSFVLLALFGGNYLIQNNKAYLLERAAQALGRKISADHIEVAFWPLGALLSRVVVAADLNLTAPEILHAKTVEVSFKFWPLLLGRIEPCNIVLEAPVLTIAREGGNDAVEANARRSKKRQSRGARGDAAPLAETPRTAPTLLPFPLQISNGTVRYHSNSGASEVLASQIQLRMIEVISGGPIDVELDAAVTAPTHNLKFRGRIGVNAGAGDYRDVPIDVALRFEALDMGKINRALPGPIKSLPKILQFDGIYTTRNLTISGSLRHPTIKGAINGSDASVRFD